MHNSRCPREVLYVSACLSPYTNTRLYAVTVWIIYFFTFSRKDCRREVKNVFFCLGKFLRESVAVGLCVRLEYSCMHMEDTKVEISFRLCRKADEICHLINPTWELIKYIIHSTYTERLHHLTGNI